MVRFVEIRPGATEVDIALDRKTEDAVARQLRAHLKDELEIDIDPFEAIALVGFLAKTLGPHFYNQGLTDAEAILRKRLDSILDAVGDLHQPVPR